MNGGNGCSNDDEIDDNVRDDYGGSSADDGDDSENYK